MKLQNIDIKNMIEDKLYTCILEDDRVFLFIYKNNNTDVTNLKSYIDINDRSFEKISSGKITSSGSAIVRLSTFDENEHYNQCVKANEYVDYKSTKQELIFKMIV